MKRALTIAIVLLTARAVQAQNNDINWQTEVKAALSAAKSKNKPLMVYLEGSSDREGHSRIERDQKRAFKDPRVLARALHFIPLKLSRSTNRDQLKDFGLAEGDVLQMRFVSPEGEPLGSLGVAGIEQPDTLAQKMKLAYEAFGALQYKGTYKAVLEDENAKPADLKAALTNVGEFNVRPAEEAVLKLLDRHPDAATHALALDALAQLSTKQAVTKLLELARAGDKAAERALTKCTPEAAELMINDVKSDSDPFDFVAYKAAGTICKVPQLKPERFFQNSPLKLKEEELARVKTAVQTASAKWKTENA